MGDLIVSVVMDVLVHVLVQHRKRLSVGRIPGPAGDFVVLDAAELACQVRPYTNIRPRLTRQDARFSHKLNP